MKAVVVQVEEHSADQPKDGGSIPTSPLHNLRVAPITFREAKILLVKHHYLHSLAGGTKLAFGVLHEQRLMGAITFGAGPFNAHSLVKDVQPDACLSLSRFWLSDELPPNSESRVLAVVLKNIRKHTSVKFVVTYADPSQGHLGTIYQATGWTYIGLSEAMPLYDLGDGKVRHCRSLSHAYGTHSVKYFADHGVTVKLVPQTAKHRYIYFLDQSWRPRLTIPILPYPKRELQNEAINNNDNH